MEEKKIDCETCGSGKFIFLLGKDQVKTNWYRTRNTKRDT